MWSRTDARCKRLSAVVGSLGRGCHPVLTQGILAMPHRSGGLSPGMARDSGGGTGQTWGRHRVDVGQHRQPGQSWFTVHWAHDAAQGGTGSMHVQPDHDVVLGSAELM